MARKRKDAVTGAVPDAAAADAPAEEHVVDPVGKAPGVTGTGAGEKPTGVRKAAVRLMTRSVAEPKPGPESAARRAGTAARPSQKPAGGRRGRGR